MAQKRRRSEGDADGLNLPVLQSAQPRRSPRHAAQQNAEDSEVSLNRLQKPRSRAHYETDRSSGYGKETRSRQDSNLLQPPKRQRSGSRSDDSGIDSGMNESGKISLI
jgi:hypothetical protein